ncbi:hypothetical protein [Vibrio maritimus]|uniref:hypothetical protein n=1 Tax=Vibrio maritimus TaxID=990268 RepID=UPI001F381D41|nr:hypothetical protein [Vibrio maritimus]
MSWWDNLNNTLGTLGGIWVDYNKSADPNEHKGKEPPKGEDSDGSTLVATPPQWASPNTQWLVVGGVVCLLLVVLLLGGRR